MTETDKIIHFRVLLDNSQDIFRDIQISAAESLFDFHVAILKSFGYSGQEMASFYLSNDEWDKGEEIMLMDMMVDHDHGEYRAMRDTPIHNVVESKGSKMLYLYDFMRMWIFYVEAIDIVAFDENESYPKVVLMVGNAPDEHSKKDAGPMPVDFADHDSYGEEDIDMDQIENSPYEPYDDSLEY